MRMISLKIVSNRRAKFPDGVVGAAVRVVCDYGYGDERGNRLTALSSRTAGGRRSLIIKDL